MNPKSATESYPALAAEWCGPLELLLEKEPLIRVLLRAGKSNLVDRERLFEFKEAPFNRTLNEI